MQFVLLFLVLVAVVPAKSTFMNVRFPWEEEVQTTERVLPQCGDKLFYYPESQICCENEVYEMKTGHEVCCGWKVYDGSAEHCCFGMIIYLEEKCKGPFHRQPFETTATPDNEM